MAKWMAGVLQIAGVPVAPAEVLRTASAWDHDPVLKDGLQKMTPPIKDKQSMLTTMWGPRSIAKLVQITPITMVYGAYIYS